MVDALRRAARWAQPRGCIIDIHPTARQPTIELDGRRIGVVEAKDAPARHAAADAAVQRAIDSGLFAPASTDTFEFFTYADSISELRDHIEANWRDARVVLEQPVAAGQPRAREHVRITKLILARGGN